MIVPKSYDTGEGKTMSSDGKNKVTTESDSYKNYMEVLDLPTALRGGTRTMRDKRTKYLPQEEGESDTKYNIRLKRSVLLGVFGRTLEKLSGEVFSRAPIYSEDMSSVMKNTLNHIDQENNNLAQFTINVFERGLCDGATHILIDYPNVDLKRQGDLLLFKDDDDVYKRLTIDIEKKKGWKPYWVHIKASQIIGFREEVVKGVKKLTQIRIREYSEEPDGLYATKLIEKIRVLFIGRYELWKVVTEDGKEKEVLEESGETFNKERIPLVTFMPGKKINRLMADPPLEGLAWLNSLHWQSSSDQRNILHYARLITLFGKCIKEDSSGSMSEILVGANKLIHADDPDADLKVVEHSGAAIGAGRQDLQDLETQMSLFGLTFLMPKSTTSATEKYLDYSENQSALKLWAEMFNNDISVCVDLTSQLLNLKEKEVGSVKFNTTFKSALQDQDTRVLLEGFIGGLLPREMVFEEYKRRGMITEETEFNTLIKGLKSDYGLNKEIEFVPVKQSGSPEGPAPKNNQPVKDTGN